MQEEVENKSVQLAIKGAKLTEKGIVKALAMSLRYLKNRKVVKRQKKMMKAAQKPTGKQTVKELIGQNQGVSTMPIGETGLGDFQRIARKYGVDFAVVKDKTKQPPVYTVFFKARDADAISQVLAEYSAKMMKKQTKQKPSVLAKLKKFKEMVASMPKKEREKRKERER